MAMWMLQQGLCLVLMFRLITQQVYGAKIPYCYPIGKQVYKEGKCVDCPKCAPGQFLNKTKLIIPNKLYGSMQCYPCSPCPNGTYSNDEKRDYFNGYKCFIHKDCGRRGHVIKTPGTDVTDTVCGECIDGYISEDWPTMYGSSYCYPCSDKDKDKKVCGNVIITPDLKPTYQPPEELGTDETVTIIIATTLGVIVLIILGIIAACWYRENKNKQHENPDAQKGLLTDIQMDGPLSSAGSSMSTGVSPSTTTTDTSLGLDWLTKEEEQKALSIRLQNDDCYVQCIGDTDRYPNQNSLRSLAFSLGLQQTQIDEMEENGEHLIFYLNKFIQCKGKNATLLVLCKALRKHDGFKTGLDNVVNKFRRNISQDVDSSCTKTEGTAAELNKDQDRDIPTDTTGNRADGC